MPVGCNPSGIYFFQINLKMARIKYAEGLEPIRKKHYGFTFIRNHYGQSILQGQRNNRTRYQRQRQRMQNIQKAIRYWRTMSAGTQNNWANFAATNPQPTKRNATEFLTGYQLFLKRNHYCFLNHGIETDFMENPSLSVLPTPAPDFVLTAGLNTIDLTELYVKNFGLLPLPGQWLNFMCVMYSENSGQFFAPVFDVLQVQDIYLDGFFLNIEMPVKIGGLVLSVFLSKPLNRSQYIKSTKIRYMGCFTTKSFTGLSDVPAITPADSGKAWGVLPDGTWGLITAGGGGGLTCEDLPACPEIISINNSIDNIIDLLLANLVTSIPAIRLGYLYNDLAIKRADITSSDDWFVPTYAQFQAWVLSFSSYASAGAFLKQTGYTNWNSPNSGALNTSLLSFVGGGSRSSTGTFSGLLGTGYYRCIQYDPYTTVPTPSLVSSGTSMSFGALSRKAGTSCRLFKVNNTDPNFTFKSYVGNNGTIYRTCVYFGYEVIMCNLAETKYRDGSDILKLTLAADWAATVLPAYCSYNNDQNYV